MRLLSKILLLCGVGVILAGCASGVRHYDDLEDAVPQEQPLKVHQTMVTLSPKAKEKLTDNAKFNVEDFQKTLDITLKAGGYLQEYQPNTVKVKITNIRARSNFSAVMFGALAGADSVDGKVEVLNENNEVIRAFNVSADYALGGFAGGMDGVRMDWLYEKFAELTLEQLQGEKK